MAGCCCLAAAGCLDTFCPSLREYVLFLCTDLLGIHVLFLGPGGRGAEIVVSGREFDYRPRFCYNLVAGGSSPDTAIICGSTG